MPLRLVTGPAGSGKTGWVLDRFVAALETEPVLVLPTVADVERFEDELLARAPVAVGGRLVTFAGLVREAATAAGVAAGRTLGPEQRAAVVAAAVRETRTPALGEAAGRRGFAPALDGFIAELQAAGIDPGAFAERIAPLAAGRGDEGRALRELASLYSAYAERTAALGVGDDHDLTRSATSALEGEPGAWGGRPVLLHGFDDLTLEQLRLVEALARSTDVSVTLVHEDGRAALRARERLLARLQTLGAEVERLPPHEGTGVLSHLERSYLVERAGRVPAGRGVALYEAAGVRAEVEQVAAEVARLMRGERPVPAGDIAVILRSPATHAALVEEVFSSYGVPVAVDARVPFARTGAGRGVLALLDAAIGSRSADALVTYLRSPGRVRSQGGVDWLERRVRVDALRTADEAHDLWTGGGRRELWELAGVRAAAGRGAGALCAALADVVRDIAEAPFLREAPVFGARSRSEQLAAAQAAEALAELAELAELDGSLVEDTGAVVELLESLEVRRHTGSVAGRVEVMGPYRARARRFAHVFVAGLVEGEFPRREREDPFLAEEDRLAVGLPDRADPRDEERYLFYVCLSRPVRRLHLSWRAADDEGRELVRSFHVDDVLELVEGAPAPRRRGLSDTVFAPELAPTEHELARSLASWRRAEPPAALGADPALAERLSARLGPALLRADWLPGSLSVPAVLDELSGRAAFGASSLEQYAECPFRYFVGHELRPREIVAPADALERGSVIHDVLESLYRELGRPEPATVEGHVARARELLAERAADSALSPRDSAARAVLRRAESDVERFLRYDAGCGEGLELVEVEAAFGREEDEHPPLDLGEGVFLHGRIDRLERTPSGRGVVRDYKSGKAVSGAEAMATELKLQLPLYLLAVRQNWGLEPAAGLYHPLGNQESQEPRGIVRAPEEPPLDTLGLKRPDRLADDDSEEGFEAALERARAEAVRIAGEIRSGHLARDPLGGACPRYCHLHPICRRERGAKMPEENGRRPRSDD